MELYKLKPPSAAWRYFAPTEWELVTQCESSGNPQTETIIVPAAITRGTARPPGLLITAWDSVSHQRWGQMERYSVGREHGLVTYTFGRPGDSSQTGGFAALTVSKERPRR